MSVKHPCTVCEKDFSLQIKLKKHINLVHINDDGDYLDINVTLTSDDKIKYFDVLRFKYHKLLTKINSLKETTYDSSYATSLSTNKREDDQISFQGKECIGPTIATAKKRRIRNRAEGKHDFTYNDGRSGCYLPKGWVMAGEDYRPPDGRKLLRSIKEVIMYMKSNSYSEEEIYKFKSEGSPLKFKLDPKLPQGWMSALSSTSLPHFQISKMSKFLAPDGEFFNGRTSAIKFMMSNNYPLSDIDLMKKLLVTEDGWENVENICGSLMKKASETVTVYMTPNFDVLRSKKKILEYLVMNDFSPEEIAQADRYISVKKRKPKFIENNSANKEPKFKMDDDGKSNSQSEIKNETLVKKSMVEKGEPSNSSQKDTHNNFDLLDKENKKNHSLLPDGWSRIKRRKLKSPNGQIFRTLKNAILYMKRNSYPEEEIIKLKMHGLAQLFEFKKSLPSGWMATVIHGPKNSVSTKFLSPNGDYLLSRPLAIKFMIEEKYDQHEIDQMKKLLIIEDGFEVIECLPKTWLMKRLAHDAKFLSPTFETYYKKSEVLEYLKSHGSTEDELKDAHDFLFNGKTKHLSLRKRKEKKKRNRKVTLKNFLDDTEKHIESLASSEDQVLSKTSSPSGLPKGWTLRKNVYHTQEGTILRSLKDAINFMQNNSFSENDILKFKQFGSTIPFRPDKNLPSGWMSAVVQGVNKFKMHKFLSPNGDYFQNRVSTIKFMKGADYNPSDIQKMINLLKTEDGFEEDANLPGSWLRRKKSCLKYEIFITPTFELIKKKMPIIEYLKKNGCSKKAVKKAYQYLFGRTKSSNNITRSDKQILNWKQDPDLPSGWESSMYDGNFLIRNINEETFKSRKDAIHYMIKNEMSPVVIFNLWNKLHLEGWVNDEENLPSGWRRRFISSSNSFEFLSPLMEVISSTEEFCKFIKTNSDISKIDVEKVLKWCTKNNI